MVDPCQTQDEALSRPPPSPGGRDGEGRSPRRRLPDGVRGLRTKWRRGPLPLALPRSVSRVAIVVRMRPRRSTGNRYKGLGGEPRPEAADGRTGGVEETSTDVELIDYQVVDASSVERASDDRPVLITVRVPST